ncbi:MAG: hypothetical protein L0H41_14875, partial [Microlunatus sp.]|nr:hypothetical protein [Microlunatus sp.]
FRALFGDMLDAVAEPSLFELGKALLLLHPARTVRDSTRAAARRSALRLLGKERYGQAKLKLRVVRRTG